jgi:hypothetical protein
MNDAMDGISAVEARIAEIQSQFASPVTTSATASSSSSSDFSALLDQAQTAASATTSAGATASTSAVAAGAPANNREQWAHDFLTQLNMPVTTENVKAMVAWQQAEGTSAMYNPLATTQYMPGDSQFNSVGVKNFASYQDGLTANIKAITNGRYPNILAALQAGNSATAVAQAIQNSPWGTGGLVLRILNGQS